jgi:hypothetical protein
MIIGQDFVAGDGRNASNARRKSRAGKMWAERGLRNLAPGFMLWIPLLASVE